MALKQVFYSLFDGGILHAIVHVHVKGIVHVGRHISRVLYRQNMPHWTNRECFRHGIRNAGNGEVT